MSVRIHPRGPLATLQDLGRPGHIAVGLARGGAMDRLAILEATALLSLPAPVAAVELAVAGARFEIEEDCRVALTGARMQARADDRSLAWNASHRLARGETLEIGGAEAGCWGYVTFAGGPEAPAWLGSHAVHLSIGVGAPFAPGDRIALTPDPAPEAPDLTLVPDDRFGGGRLRLMPGPQSALFDDATSRRFFATEFRRAAAANRQGVRLDFDGAPFASETARLASDFIQPGDVQLTGDGVPYVLMAECQTIGGYPRIGTVHPADLPRLAQAPEGAALRFEALSLRDADALRESETATLARLRRKVAPLRSQPRVRDLMGVNLVGGVVRGDEA